MRRGMLGITLAAIMVTMTAHAQGDIPNGAFVRDATGVLWLVSNGARVRVPIHPAPADQVAAIPETDRWLVPLSDGTLTFGDQPEWGTVPTVLEWSGTNDQNSRPFALAAGTYTAHWSAKLQPRQSSCFVGAKLRRVSDQSTAASIFGTSLNQQGSATMSGETQIYGIKDDRYYLESSTTGCDWSVSLTPSP